MIISMSEVFDYSRMIAVTNRKLCRGEFEAQLRKTAACHPAGLILREKDLADADYEALSRRTQQICAAEGVPFIVHARPETARVIGCRNLHLPLSILRKLGGRPEGFDWFSVSCHSREDVEYAQILGANRIILGTVFETGCKPGLPGKGLSFVREICAATSLPVYAIGGIKPENLASVMAAGAAGGCMMSGFMQME